MPATIIRTGEPSAFLPIVAASGIGLAPFVLDAPAPVRAAPFLRLVCPKTAAMGDPQNARPSRLLARSQLHA